MQNHELSFQGHCTLALVNVSSFLPKTTATFANPLGSSHTPGTQLYDYPQATALVWTDVPFSSCSPEEIISKLRWEAWLGRSRTIIPFINRYLLDFHSAENQAWHKRIHSLLLRRELTTSDYPHVLPDPGTASSYPAWSDWALGLSLCPWFSSHPWAVIYP